MHIEGEHAAFGLRAEVLTLGPLDLPEKLILRAPQLMIGFQEGDDLLRVIAASRHSNVMLSFYPTSHREAEKMLSPSARASLHRLEE